jgi:hypothetical protein
MTRYKRILVFCLVTLTLVMAPLSTFAVHDEILESKEPPDPGVMLVDLVLARPGGLVATIAGSVIFVAALPFSLLGGNTDETWESLVVSPAEYTFKRPVGRFKD